MVRRRRAECGAPRRAAPHIKRQLLGSIDRPRSSDDTHLPWPSILLVAFIMLGDPCTWKPESILDPAGEGDDSIAIMPHLRTNWEDSKILGNAVVVAAAAANVALCNSGTYKKNGRVLRSLLVVGNARREHRHVRGGESSQTGLNLGFSVSKIHQSTNQISS